jgi:hypothetical protein
LLTEPAEDNQYGGSINLKGWQISQLATAKFAISNTKSVKKYRKVARFGEKVRDPLWRV